MTTTETLDARFDRLDVDHYCEDYDKRAEAGSINDLDRANTAVRRAEQAASIIAGNRETMEAGKRAEALLHFKRCRRAAALVPQAMAEGASIPASVLADFCEAEAARIEAFDSARFDGLVRPQALDAFGDRQREAGKARKH